MRTLPALMVLTIAIAILPSCGQPGESSDDEMAQRISELVDSLEAPVTNSLSRNEDSESATDIPEVTPPAQAVVDPVPTVDPVAEAAAAEERRREREQRRQSLARQYAESAARQVMEQIGGGQDLIVDVNEWQFDEYTDQFRIEVSISFNGAIIRANNYQVVGVLTVDDSGHNASFARRWANEQFKSIEHQLTIAAAAAAVIIALEDLGN